MVSEDTNIVNDIIIIINNKLYNKWALCYDLQIYFNATVSLSLKYF